MLQPTSTDDAVIYGEQVPLCYQISRYLSAEEHLSPAKLVQQQQAKGVEVGSSL